MTVNLRKMAKFNPRQQLSVKKKNWKLWSLVPAGTFLTSERNNQKGAEFADERKNKITGADFKVTWWPKGCQLSFLQRLTDSENSKQLFESEMTYCED